MYLDADKLRVWCRKALLRANDYANTVRQLSVETTALKHLSGAPGRGSCFPVSPCARERTGRRYLAAGALSFCLAFGLVWIYTLMMPMAFMSRDYPAWVAKRAMLENCKLGVASFFGDSRAMAGIDPRELPFESSNFALSGSSPLEAYFISKRLLRCAKRPKVVVLDYSPGKFLDDSNYWNMSARLGVVSFADMRDVQKESESLQSNEIQDLRLGDHLGSLVRRALFASRFPPFYFDSLISGYVFARFFHNAAAEQEIFDDRGHAFFGTDNGSNREASETTIKQFRVSAVVNFYFTATIAAFAAAKISVIIMSPPINEATCHHMNAVLRPSLARYLEGVVAAYPNARVIGPVAPCWTNQLFGDAFHLNARGTTLYGAHIVQWLKPVIDKTD